MNDCVQHKYRGYINLPSQHSA